MGLPEISVTVTDPQPIYPGRPFRGCVVFNLKEKRTLKLFFGPLQLSLQLIVQSELFIRRSSRLSFTEENEETQKVTDLGMEDLLEGKDASERIIDSGGEQRIPFSFNGLNPTLPGTLITKDKTRTGKDRVKHQICYWVKADVEYENGRRELSEPCPFRVMELSKLSQFPAFFGYSYTKEAEQVVTSGFFKRHTGSVKCTLDFSKHHFHPGEDMHISVRVRNESKTTFKGVEMWLVRLEEISRSSMSSQGGGGGGGGRSESGGDIHAAGGGVGLLSFSGSLPTIGGTGTVVLVEKIKQKIRHGDNAELRTTIRIPADLHPLTTSQAFQRKIIIRYEFNLNLLTSSSGTVRVPGVGGGGGGGGGGGRKWLGRFGRRSSGGGGTNTTTSTGTTSSSPFGAGGGPLHSTELLILPQLLLVTPLLPLSTTTTTTTPRANPNTATQSAPTAAAATIATTASTTKTTQPAPTTTASSTNTTNTTQIMTTNSSSN